MVVETSGTAELVARYDKRFLSQTELTYLCTPGRPEPTVLGVDWVRLGLATCIEANSPRCSPRTSAWTSTASFSGAAFALRGDAE